MSAQDNGGPAFPMHPEIGNAKECYGMTLRDYFAAQAMAAMVSNPEICDTLLGTVVKTISDNAYRMADAMLAERAK